jgi:hypothetical protein
MEIFSDVICVGVFMNQVSLLLFYYFLSDLIRVEANFFDPICLKSNKITKMFINYYYYYYYYYYYICLSI